MESNQDRISKAILAVNHAIEQGEVLSVVTTLQSFFKEWNKDIVVNQFYRMSEYKSVLSEMYKFFIDSDCDINCEVASVLSNLSIESLIKICLEKNDNIDEDALSLLQDHVLENGTENEKLLFAGVEGTDFKKIQDSIIAGNDCVVMKNFYLSYPDKADLGALYARVYRLSENKNSYQNERQICLSILKKYKTEKEKREREEYIERKYSQDNKGVKVY